MMVDHQVTVKVPDGYHPKMRFGPCLPNFTGLASPETFDAATASAERLG